MSGIVDEELKFVNIYRHQILLATLPFDNTEDCWGRFKDTDKTIAYHLRKIDNEWRMTAYLFDEKTGYIKLNRSYSVSMEVLKPSKKQKI